MALRPWRWWRSAPLRACGSVGFALSLAGCAGMPASGFRTEPVASTTWSDQLQQVRFVEAAPPSKPPSKPPAKPEAKPAAKPAAKPEAKPAAKPAASAEAEPSLSAEAVVGRVLESNPTIAQMKAAAAAAAAKFPQAISLDDPMFSVQAAPLSIGSRDIDFSSRLELSQKLPWAGKRELKGAAAVAEARAAAREIDDARLQLVESAKSAFGDDYAAEKSLTVVEESLKLLGEFRRNAETRYRNGLAPQQDMLQADVEIARTEERRLGLKRARQVAVARLNTLAHQPADAPLPAAADLPVAMTLGSAAELRARAAANRPDLNAMSDRLAADEAMLNLAQLEYKPDVEVLGVYDGFWQGPGGRLQQLQIGARVNLPVRLARRQAAVCEAQAKVAERRANLARLNDQIAYQVREALERCRESDAALTLYEAKALPAAEANVKEAQASYVAGKTPFLALVEAQRNVIALRERRIEAKAETFRRRATLDRVVGEATCR